jgi:8-oxo-dGTP pyrophosphatase MutT (NUDIX family)
LKATRTTIESFLFIPHQKIDRFDTFSFPLKPHPMSLRVIPSRNGGVEIDSSSIPSDPLLFSQLLNRNDDPTIIQPTKVVHLHSFSLSPVWDYVVTEWKEEWFESHEKCLVWLSLGEKQGKHVVLAIEENGFEFHHARDKSALLVLNTSPATIETAPYADLHPAAAGCVVSNDGKVLLMTEKHKYFPSDWVQWKMPGGSIDPGESIVDGCLRETYEETGVKCDFIGILAIRHVTRFWWQAADMYCICLLRPQTMDLNPDFVSEVDRCEWHSLKDVVENMQIFPVQRAAFEHCIRVLQGEAPLLVPEPCIAHCGDDDYGDDGDGDGDASGGEKGSRKSGRCFRYVPLTKKWMDLPFDVDIPHPSTSKEETVNIN